jgi:hypothetical protein
MSHDYVKFIICTNTNSHYYDEWFLHGREIEDASLKEQFRINPIFINFVESKDWEGMAAFIREGMQTAGFIFGGPPQSLGIEDITGNFIKKLSFDVICIVKGKDFYFSNHYYNYDHAEETVEYPNMVL